MHDGTSSLYSRVAMGITPTMIQHVSATESNGELRLWLTILLTGPSSRLQAVMTESEGPFSVGATMIESESSQKLQIKHY